MWHEVATSGQTIPGLILKGIRPFAGWQKTAREDQGNH
jgi:hypothetical protein